MSVTVIYGSDGGCTRKIAKRINGKVGGTLLDIKKAQRADFENASLLILGCPTYGGGDLQTDWEARVDVLREANLAGRKVALFGTGDQVNYPDSFIDAIGILYDIVVERGARVVGFTDTEGYDFTGSAALRDDRFVGLALDEDNQANRTEKRLAAWLELISRQD
ncbi:flavodoxin FldA [Roseomonas sp. NAR14]|uniref:Flavodoxin n=1 Tax=Roseomonas acroporae TaxID=2937791 RepID=A0A9X2BVA9_9PROT|nr:flavodoxin FldA [Roseomonas acroporae]MCK8783824.1 flavodoxin FldA [Roseomonas acroporae]